MDVLTFLRLQWDRVGAWAAIMAGALALLLGYIGVSGTGFTAVQLPYLISGGLGGIFLLGLGATLWLSADLRDEWRKLDDVERLLEERLPAPPAVPTAPAPSETALNGAPRRARPKANRAAVS